MLAKEFWFSSYIPWKLLNGFSVMRFGSKKNDFDNSVRSIWKENKAEGWTDTNRRQSPSFRQETVSGWNKQWEWEIDLKDISNLQCCVSKRL